MATLKEILDNELMKTILEIKIDSVWKLLSLKNTPHYPNVNEEGATGHYDNKGAMFVPGGFIFEDSDKRAVKPKDKEDLTSSYFRDKIIEAMQYDNATLLFQENVVKGVNLDNGFFSEVASNIIEIKDSATRRSKKLGDKPAIDFSSDEITHSHTPNYINAPYGSRTKLSSCLSVCLSEPRVYYTIGKHIFGLRNGDELEFWDSIRNSMNPLIGNDRKVLAPPYLVVCHNTRYKEEIVGGITKVLGIGKFGEFVTITFENTTSNLLNEIVGNRTNFHEDEIVASHDNYDVVGIARIFQSANPGKRPLKFSSYIISPEDVGIDKDKIKKDAVERYNIN